MCLSHMMQNTPKREHISLIFARSHFNEEIKAPGRRLCFSSGVVVQPAPLMKQISIVSVSRQATCQGTLCQERQVWNLDTGVDSQKFSLCTVYRSYKPCPDSVFPKDSVVCSVHKSHSQERLQNTTSVRQCPASLGGVSGEHLFHELEMVTKFLNRVIYSKS